MFGESVEETIAFLESAFYRVKGIPILFDAAWVATNCRRAVFQQAKHAESRPVLTSSFGSRRNNRNEFSLAKYTQARRSTDQIALLVG